MRVVYFFLFFLINSLALADDNPFKIFDNYKYYENNSTKIKIDGKLSDTCLAVSKAYEKAIDSKSYYKEKLEIVKLLGPNLDFIKFCIKKDLLEQ